MQAEQGVEKAVDELPLSLPLKLLRTEKASEEIAAAEVDKVAEVTRLKLIKSEGGGGQS